MNSASQLKDIFKDENTYEDEYENVVWCTRESKWHIAYKDGRECKVHGWAESLYHSIDWEQIAQEDGEPLVFGI